MDRKGPRIEHRVARIHSETPPRRLSATSLGRPRIRRRLQGAASHPGGTKRAARFARLELAALVAALGLAGCGPDDEIWFAEEWDVSVTTTDEHVLISPTIADVDGYFIHMSVRRDGHDNGYTVERSPAPDQPHRDWTRVHHWFGEMHPDTYLEGRIDDGRGRGPSSFQTFEFELPRVTDPSRMNFPDLLGSDYEYITRGYSYTDGNYRHPPFEPGSYEVEIYAWYTGSSSDTHPAAGGEEGVQYVYYDTPLVSTEFVIE